MQYFKLNWSISATNELISYLVYFSLSKNKSYIFVNFSLSLNSLWIKSDSKIILSLFSAGFDKWNDILAEKTE